MILDCLFWLLFLLSVIGAGPWVGEPYSSHRGWFYLILIGILGFKVVTFH
jgi:hypothetical protein